MDNELTRVAQEINDLYEELGTWELVGEHYGTPKITPWRIANDDYEPKTNDVRRLFGLKEIIEIRRNRDEKGRFS